jgi:hypothetical protein
MIISLNVDETQKDRVINALVNNYQYQDTIDGKPNTETKPQFAKRMLIEFLKNHTRDYETKVEQAKISVKNDLNIT